VAEVRTRIVQSEALRRVRDAGPAVPLFAGAVVGCVGAVLLILERRLLLAGIVALAAGVALVAATLSARTRGLGRARFSERMLDRIYDASVLAPLAWVLRPHARVAVLALACLAASNLAAYERARGDSLGYRTYEGTGYRVLRVGLLSLALLSGWVEPFLWAFAVLTAAAAVLRALNIAAQTRREAEHADEPLDGNEQP
jgi:hypothetical protein